MIEEEDDHCAVMIDEEDLCNGESTKQKICAMMIDEKEDLCNVIDEGTSARQIIVS